ncbi:oligoendopeptidase F [Lacticaseibacillus sharpeae]|uniref:Oligopeptidase F n=1 Tax=Lacticaseibacillus sharpeae JCM 1186 = DSM 20505 TaxID=1291052 RepID=A0A0R1ZKJ7_9LACO|nr:oligoendopeptidase F [Lacticaseibacillus sharpeae]KRM55039.1 M3 family oligoendopeptidase F [Lacticaseibacillus sharpeae JCM 1186 = DSM 20505]
MSKLPPRSAVDPAETWDLTALFPDEAAYSAGCTQLRALADAFTTKYQPVTRDANTIIAALNDYADIVTLSDRLAHYAFLPQAADGTDNTANSRLNAFDTLYATVFGELSFFEAGLATVPNSVLDVVAAQQPEHAGYLRHIRAQKQSALDPAAEKVLATLAPALSAPDSMRSQAIARDMDFGTFTAHGQEYPLSFVSYEETYQKHPDTEIRRAAYKQFNATLAKYQNVIATGYYNQVMKEKAIATMRGYDSVIDYLLAPQEVTRDMFNRQIDVIMTELAPVMQRYEKFVRKLWGLDHTGYTDLQIDIDPTYSPKFTIAEAKELILNAVSVLGPDYQALIARNFSERWTDYPANIGKESGAFTSMAYGTHPYILQSWASNLPSVYTLVHELGHAGQMMLAGAAQGPLNWMPSTYIVEAPSTFHELLATDELLRTADSDRLRRFALSRLLNDTYFHNFVTHLLEAAFQREVYTLIDNGESFDAAKLNSIKAGVLKQFWGDAVELEPGAELTWMRQSHYYLGLYSYTYSAGLTISTQAFLNLRENREQGAKQWLDFLSLGDSVPPVAAAKVAGVDVTSDAALHATIQFLDDTEREIEELSKKID